MIKALVEITKVSKYQREDQDGFMQNYAECWFRELGCIDGNYQNRGNFRLRGAEAENVQIGDQGDVELRLERKELTSRAGNTFYKTEVNCVNWHCTRPKEF